MRQNYSAIVGPFALEQLSAATYGAAPTVVNRRLKFPAKARLSADDHIEFLVRLRELVGEGFTEPNLVRVALTNQTDFEATRQALRVVGHALTSLYCADYYARASGCNSANVVAALAVRLRYQLSRQLTHLLHADLQFPILYSEADEGQALSTSSEDLNMRLVGAVYESNGIRAAFALLDWAVTRVDMENWLPGDDFSRFLSSYCMLRFGGAPLQKKSILRSDGQTKYGATLRTSDRNESTASGATRIQAERNASELYVRTYLGISLASAVMLPLRDLSRPVDWGSAVPNESALEALTFAYKPIPGMLDLFGIATLREEMQQSGALSALVERRDVLTVVGRAAIRLLVHSRIAHEYVRTMVPKGRPSLQEYASNANPNRVVTKLAKILGWIDASHNRERRGPIMTRNAVTATFGAYFECARDRMSYIDEVLPPVQEVESFLNEWAEDFVQRDLRSLRSQKQLLNERCQIFGLIIAFESESLSRAGVNFALIRLRLRFRDQQLAEADLPEMATRDPKVIERQLSHELIETFDVACGIGPTRQTPALSGGLLDFGRLFLSHSLDVLSGRFEGLTPQIVLARTKDQGALGLHWLRLGILDDYLDWLRSAESLLGRHVVDEHGLSFYGIAGEADGVNADPLRGMGQVCSDAVRSLEALEPESYSVIPASTPFAAIAELASIHRLLATPRRWTSVCREVLIDVVAQFTIMRWSVADAPDSKNYDLSCWQRPGVVLEAIGRLVHAITRFAPMRAPQDRVSIKVSDSLFIQFHLNAINAVQISSVVQSLERSLLFAFIQADASVDLTINESAHGAFVLSLRFCCGNEGVAKVALSTYRTGRPLPAEVCGALATRLHDAKNGLVACAAATNNAGAALNRTDRLRHLLSASQHLDGALAHLRTVHELLGVDRPTMPEDLDLLAFFRALTTELLTWVPRSVNFVPPDNVEEATFATDPYVLRAAIVNLCKNSVEAMESKGRLAISWRIDEHEQLHVAVLDSGPGFTAEQLELLNTGEIIASTKQDGSGAGLLSVSLLLGRLGGRVVFKSADRGAEVGLVVPPAGINSLAEDHHVEIGEM